MTTLESNVKLIPGKLYRMTSPQAFLSKQKWFTMPVDAVFMYIGHTDISAEHVVLYGNMLVVPDNKPVFEAYVTRVL